MSCQTLGSVFNPKSNSLNFLRLTLALMVLLSHDIVFGSFGREDFLNGTSLGTVAVYGFFGISGFLIAASAERNNVGRYVWQRFLRIFPGFWVALLLTAFLFGSIAWLTTTHHPPGLSAYLNDQGGPVGYVVNNWLLKINQVVISGVMANGSLWTLFYEFLCYLILALLGMLGLLRRRSIVLLLAVGTWLTTIVFTWMSESSMSFSLLHNWTWMNLFKFAAIFLVGACIWLFREHIPDSGWLALVCTALFVGDLALPDAGLQPAYFFAWSAIAAPLVAYPLLWLGVHLPLQRIGSRNDYSYGIYIYAYPVGTLLGLWHVQRWGYLPFVLLNIVGMAPFAVLSWWLVEGRALRLKKLDWHNLWRRVTGSPRPGARYLEAEVSPESSGSGSVEPGL